MEEKKRAKKIMRILLLKRGIQTQGIIRTKTLRKLLVEIIYTTKKKLQM